MAAGRQIALYGLLGAVIAATFTYTALDNGGDSTPKRSSTLGPNAGDTAAPSATTVVATTSISPTTIDPFPTTTTTPPGTAATGATPPGTAPYDGLSDPSLSGRPWSDTVQGMLTFRGNPTRTFYGTGPVPRAPTVQWQRPTDGTWCSESGEFGTTRTWCGTGWTGQPAVWERDGKTWVAFGAYDRKVHVLDGATGVDIRPPFPTGDIIKGSVTVDPDGYPILYTGSRDNYYRALALDQPQLTELWKLSAKAVSPTKWNDDWDGSGIIIDDYLFEGGENSQFHVVKLNRAYGADGKVTLDPKMVFHTPGWTQQLLDDVGDNDVSIENSVAVAGNVVYFANSGGLVQGWDMTGLADGATPKKVFSFWTGDDTDASIVIDADGFLYVGSEYERGTKRSKDLGQFFKLDPRKVEDPVVWSLPIAMEYTGDGVWATAGLWKDLLIVPTDHGTVYGIDRATGVVRWTKKLPGPLWQSPVIVDDVWIQGDCKGDLHAYNVSDTTIDPPELWSIHLGGCIESTPTVWKGRIYVGTRDGHFYALA